MVSISTSKKILHGTIIAVAALVVISCAVVAYRVWRGSGATVMVGGKMFHVEVVDTPEAMATGLSGRDGIGENQGMLFVFERDGAHAFWMKGMRFAIDIVWIDKDKRVVHVEQNVSPDDQQKMYKPPRHARYVLEVAAGGADVIANGEMVIFGGGL